MKNRRGPYGHFAVTTVDESKEIYEYAMQIIEYNRIDGLLQASCDERRNGLELSFDYSGLQNLNECTFDTKDTISKREAVRDFFMLLISLLDCLLPLDNIYLDPEYMSTNNSILLNYAIYPTNQI